MASPRLTEPILQRTQEERDTIHEQLERVLNSAVFRNSRRNSSLLRHAVERVLEGRPDELKERAIGIDVFGREAHYDTNSDHVVRSVAGEVRRRLAQYYMEPGRETELRIELQAGSYVPQFRIPPERASFSAVTSSTEVPVVQPLETAPAVPPKTAQWRSWPVLVAASAVLIAGASLFAARTSGPTDAFGRFWSPVFSSANMALLCVGGGGAVPAMNDAPPTIGEFERLPSRRMHTSDALALAGLVGLLQSNGKPYRILNRASLTSFRDLQLGPFVLIGAMNNEWTLRLTSNLRFGFEMQQNGARLVDRQNPSNADWSVDFTTPLPQFNRDYAIVSRVRDPRPSRLR